MSSERKRISADSVVRAIRRLMDGPSGRTGRAALLGYLLLKSREAEPGHDIEVRATGVSSVQQELERFFGLAPGSGLPYVNPFGRSVGRLQWLTAGYERGGIFTHLRYPGRTLAPFVSVRQQGDRVLVRIPPSAPAEIARELGGRVPLEPLAALTLRRESFRDSAGPLDLVQRFRQVFHLTQQEVDTLFESDPAFVVEFDDIGFQDDLSSLPPDLHPWASSGGHAAVVEASRDVISLAPVEVADLVFSDPVLRRARRALARGKAVALVGPPGTGKSRLVAKLVDEARGNPGEFGLSESPEFDLRAAETDWTARTIIGGYFPQEDGRLVFQEGHLLSALRRNRWLVLDEMNRADLDRVLGPVLTFLAGQNVDIGQTELTEKGRPVLLAWGTEPRSGVFGDDGEAQRVYVAGTDWRLIGTYNNVDVGRVFSMGAALSRRWATVPVTPLSTEGVLGVLRKVVGLPPGVAELIARVYAVHLEVLPLGPAPFVDMARFVSGPESVPPSVGGASGAVSPDVGQRLRDAYILHLGPQLRRVDPDRRGDFFDSLSTILGADLSDELAATF